jgi:hypothetical protein
MVGAPPSRLNVPFPFKEGVMPHAAGYRSVYFYKGQRIVFTETRDPDVFAVVVDDLEVTLTWKAKDGNGTLWTCQCRWKHSTNKATIAKHVAGVHYPILYRRASRANALPQKPYIPEKRTEPRVKDPREIPIGVLNAWVHGAKPEKQNE